LQLSELHYRLDNELAPLGLDLFELALKLLVGDFAQSLTILVEELLRRSLDRALSIRVAKPVHFGARAEETVPLLRRQSVERCQSLLLPRLVSGTDDQWVLSRGNADSAPVLKLRLRLQVLLKLLLVRRPALLETLYRVQRVSVEGRAADVLLCRDSTLMLFVDALWLLVGGERTLHQSPNFAIL
jgi:hypothetical protein